MDEPHTTAGERRQAHDLRMAITTLRFEIARAGHVLTNPKPIPLAQRAAKATALEDSVTGLIAAVRGRPYTHDGPPGIPAG